MAATGTLETSFVNEEEFSYGDHELQKLTVYHPVKSTPLPKTQGVWLIYIHGGAWRDPTITDKSFLPTIRELYSDPARKSLVESHITAFASISYRLSAHPAHPQDPATPANKLRAAKHPDHVQDVLAAISLLQEKYKFGERYILLGHSCGATLIFQAIMRSLFDIPALSNFINPECVVGVAGIYDMKLLRDNNPHPAYQEFLAGAFGTDEKIWDQASPASITDLSGAWPEAKNIFLFASSQDELVDEAQVEVMWASLKSMAQSVRVRKDTSLLDLTHNHIWDEGVGMAEVVAESLRLREEGGLAGRQS